MKDNPYIGPRPYQRGEANFFGREREGKELAWLILAEQAVLFYAQSGAGKTSLLNARVIPILEQKGVRVLPVMRVGSGLPASIAPDQVENVFVFSALLGLTAETDTPSEALLEHSLLSYLQEYVRQSPSDDHTPTLLIFDQFEEIATTHREYWDQVEGFFHQVRAAIDALPNLGVLFVLREDYVAELDPYTPLLPSHLQARFRMTPPTRAQAMQIVMKPAEQAGCPFTEEATHNLVTNLSRIKTLRSPSPPVGSERIGQYVEPVQLQVVCQQLWDSLPDSVSQDGVIEWHEIQHYDVDHALTTFYESALINVLDLAKAKEPAHGLITERRLRRWFSEQLITPEGRRGLALQGQIETAGLPGAVVTALENHHLIRAETRGGSRWYELSHDRLVEPIVQSNQGWEVKQDQTHPWRPIARQWKKTSNDSLLYQGRALEEAQTWFDAASPGEVEPYEREFIQASQQAEQTRLEAYKRRRTIVATSVVVSILMAILTFVSVWQWQAAVEQQAIAEAERDRADQNAAEVQRQVRLAHSGSLAAQVQVIRDEDPQRSLLLVVEAISATLTLDKVIPAAETALRQAVGVTGSLSLRGYEGLVDTLAFSPPDGRLLAMGSSDGTARVWRVADPQAEPVVLSGHEGAVTALAFSPPDGHWLATGSNDGTTRIWDLSAAVPGVAPLVLIGHEEPVSALAFSPDGRLLATGSSDSTARVWHVTDPQAEPVVLSGHKGVVTALAFSPDEQWLATVSVDGTARVWRVADPQTEPVIWRGHKGDVVALAFSPDGRLLATGSSDSTARLWHVANPQTEPVILSGHEGAVNALAFSPDGRLLATGSSDSTARLWHMADPQAEPVVLIGHEDAVDALAFSPDGRLLATGSSDSTARLWRVADPQAGPVTLNGHGSRIKSLVFSPDERWLAMVSADGTARLWNMRLEELIDLACRTAGRNLSWAEWKQYVYWEPYRKTCSNLQVHPSVIEFGRDLARKGDTQAASDHFRRVLELEPGLALDPEEEATYYSAAPNLVQDGQRFAQTGEIKKAIECYNRAQEIDPHVEIDAEDWNNLCRSGSLNGYAAEVLFACEKAVELAPGDYHDSRGLARALMGDHVGAIDDFNFVVEQWQKQSVCGSSSVNRCTQLQDLIKVLEAGQSLDREEMLAVLLPGLQVYVPEAGYLNLRQVPSISGSVLTQLPHAMLLESLEEPAVTLTKVGQHDEWLHVRTPDGQEGYVAAWYLILPLESEPDENRPVNQIVLTDDLDGTERQVAMHWNRQGNLLSDIAAELEIELAVAVAVYVVEGGGESFGPDGRMVIRFENQIFYDHWGKNNPDLFNQHFQFDPDRRWTGHQWRPSPDVDWRTIHGDQDSEWDAFNFARTLDEVAAMASISMGGPQIMGFNYEAVDYNSVQEMFDAFAESEENQVIGFFNFVRSRGAKTIQMLQNLDFEGFAALYNGPGQAEFYGELMQRTYDAFKSLQ